MEVANVLCISFCCLPQTLQRGHAFCCSVWYSTPVSIKNVHPPQIQSQHWCAEAEPQLQKRMQWFILSWKMTQRGNCMLWNDIPHCNLLWSCLPAIPYSAFPLEIRQTCQAHSWYKPLQRHRASYLPDILYTADNCQSLAFTMIQFSVTGDTKGKFKWVRRGVRNQNKMYIKVSRKQKGTIKRREKKKKCAQHELLIFLYL